MSERGAHSDAMGRPRGKGRGGRSKSAGRGKQLPPEQPAMPANQFQKNPIQSLVRLAISASNNAAHRVAALKELHKVLCEGGSATASTIQGLLPELWPQMLGLLGDTNADVRQTAAPVIGVLGALATKQGARPGMSPGLLFDWALPLLNVQQGPADSSKGVDVGSMFWVMAALKEGLQHCDDKTVSRYGHALFNACQALLESDDLSVHLLAPLLGLLSQAARHLHSLRAHFKDVVDLLLGWSLEPSLPEMMRPLLYNTFLSFEPIWREQQGFAAGLVDNLVSDLLGLTTGTNLAINIENLTQLLSLSSCVTAIVQACGQGSNLNIHGLLQRIAKAMQSAVSHYQALFSNPSSIPTATEEMCHSLTVILHAAFPSQHAKEQQAGSSSQNDTASKEVSKDDHSAAASLSSIDPVQIKDSSLDAEANSTAVNPGVASLMAVLGFVLEMLRGNGQWAKSPDLMAALKLNLAVLDLLGNTPDKSIPHGVLDLVLGHESPFPQLRHHGDKEVTDLVTHTDLCLLQHPHQSIRTAALQLLLADLQANLAQATQGGASEESVKSARYSLQLLSQDFVQRQHAASIWSGLHELCMPPGNLQKQLWIAALHLLEAVSYPASDLATLSYVPISEALPFWSSLAMGSQEPAGQLLSTQWLVRAAELIIQQHHTEQGSVGEENNLEQATQQLDIGTAHEIGSNLMTEQDSMTPLPVMRLIAAACDAIVSLSQATDEALRKAAAVLTHRLLAPASINSASNSSSVFPQQATVRSLADSPVPSIAGSSGSKQLLLTDEQLTRMGQAACERLSDVSAAVTAQWSLLFAELQPHLARIATGIGTHNPSLLQNAQVSWRSAVAVQPQQQLLQPLQMMRLLDWLTRASPSILTRPQAAPTILTRRSAASGEDAAPVRKEADQMEWLVQLPINCPPLDGTDPATLRTPTSYAEAACWAVQESARQCVADRLRTHYGGPAQTFAALEAGLEARLSKGQHMGNLPHQGAVTELRSSWLFLDFMMALERQIQAACSGSCALPLPSPPALSFFTVAKNRKACEEWFVRLRPLQLRLAAAVGQQGAIVFHACAHLAQLNRQAAALLVPPSPEPTALAPATQQPPMLEPAAGPAAPLGQTDWPSLAAAAVPTNKHGAGASAQDRKRSKQAARLERKKQGGRKAVPVRPRILQRSSEADEPAVPVIPIHKQVAQKKTTPRKQDIKDQNAMHSAAAADLHASMVKLIKEVLSTLRRACSALCTQGNPDAISGLHAYSLKMFAQLFSAAGVQPAVLHWMKGMQSEAAGNYQEAAKIYMEALRPAGTATIPDGVAFLSGRAAAAYAAIADWENLNIVSSMMVGGIPPSTRALAALDRGNKGLAAELLTSMSQWSAEGLPHPGTVAPAVTPRAARAQQSITSPPATSTRLSEQVILKALLALQETGSAQDELAAATQTPMRIISRGGMVTKASEQSDALTAAMEDVKAEQQRLHAILTVVSSEGMLAAAPLLGDGWVALLLGQALDARLRGTSGQQQLLDLSRQVAQTAAGAGLLVREIPAFGDGTQEISRLGSGTCIANIRPWLVAERILRIASGRSIAGGSQQLHHSTLLHCIAAAARRSGNASLASRLLDSVGSDGLVSPGEHFPEPESDQAFSRRYLEAAASAALRGSVLSKQAKASYADWLWMHQTQYAAHAPSGETLSERKEAPQLVAEQSSRADTEKTEDSKGGAGAMSRHALNCLEAYCSSLESASIALFQPGSSEDQMVALLRILQVQAEQIGGSPEHDDAIRQAVARVPVSQWHVVTPQLFSYLAHSQDAVRASVVGILSRLESSMPSAVLYPALAALNREGDNSTTAEVQQVLEAFRQQQPKALDHANVFVEELTRIASLWEDQWMHALQEVQAEVERRLGALQREAAYMQALQESPSDIQKRMAERYAIVMAPAVLLLEQTAAATFHQEPTTPHEQAFREEFSSPLTEAIAAFRSSAPPNFDANDRPAAALLEPLCALAGRIEQRCRVSHIMLADVSPRLAAMSATALPIPAQASDNAGEAFPMLNSVEARIEILGTKTRPKRMWLLGSDGARYSFLLKGREDLRLDERLMQLLRCSNAVLRSSSTSSSRQLHVPTFGVIPLGTRTGLIEWVDHTVPLFGIYQNSRRHSMLAAGHPDVRAQPATEAQVAQPILKLPTPTEAFYGHLVPALKAAGIDTAAPRKDWPLAVLRQVITELIREVPRDMLVREIVAGADGPADWCRRQQTFARSAAVMSMVGWLLGLGDRHLDNILFDKRSGQLVHIDYNVVFERGKQLRVPEIVPFRLTQVMQAALGVTGIEGTFRLGAEATLEAMRAADGALSTVLQSTLNDASVELSSGHHMTAMQKEADVAVTLGLVALRINELGERLFAKLAQLTEVLGAAGAALQHWGPVFQQAASAVQAAEHAHEQAVSHQAALTGAQARREGTLERLSSAQAAEGQMRHEIGGLRSAIEQNLRECRGWAERHAYTVHKLCSSAVQELNLPTEYWLSSASRSPLGLVNPVGNPASFAVVSVALGSAIRPPPDLLGLCAAVDEKAADLFNARDQSLLSATAALQEYAAALQQVLPPSYLSSSHHGKWEQAFELALIACDGSISGKNPSPADTEGVFVHAWEQAPSEPSVQDAVTGHRALCVAAEAALSAAAAAQGHEEEVRQVAAEGAQAAESARSALLQVLQEEGAACLSSAASALVASLQERLSWIQAQAPLLMLQHLQNLVLGLAAVADVSKRASGGAHPPAVLRETGEIQEASLKSLCGQISCAAHAQAVFDALVAPALVGCAAAGPNCAMLKDAGSVNRTRQLIDGISHASQQLAGNLRVPASASVVSELDTLQQSAVACVEQSEALIADAQAMAADSPVLPALQYLSVSLKGLFEEEKTSREGEAQMLSKVKGWEATAFTIRLMDDLLRVCFEQASLPAAQPLPSSQPADIHTVTRASSSGPAPQSSAAPGNSAAHLAPLQATLADALGGQLLHATSAVLASFHEAALKAQASAKRDAEAAVLLQANPLLESADQELNRLEQEGALQSEEDADGLDWLDEEAALQQTHVESSDREGTCSALQGTGREEEGEQSQSPQKALQPFLDFDEDAGAAEWDMEAASDESLHAMPAWEQLQYREMSHQVPELKLQPFLDFDEGLGGPESALESGIELGSSDSSDSASSSASQQSFAELDLDVRSTSDAADVQPLNAAAAAQPSGAASMDRLSVAAEQELSAEGVRCLSLMKACAEACGAHMFAELQRAAVLAVLQQVSDGNLCHAMQNIPAMRMLLSHLRQWRKSCDCLSCIVLHQIPRQQAANAAALALYEWMHEPELAAAGVLGPPIEVAPQGQQGWTLRHRRSQLLGALDAALRKLGSVEEHIAAWAAHSAAAESALQAAVSPPGEAAMGAASRLGHFLELRRQWLTIAADQAASLMRLGQAVLQLEMSREGKAWAGTSAPMGSCEACRPLMQQMQLLCTACVAAVNEAQNARAELGNLEAELAVAAPALDAAQLAEHKASAEFAALVAPVLERSAAAEAACNAALSALEGSWLRRMEFIAHDVKQLAAQDVLADGAVRGLAREVLEGHRCVAAARPAMSAALLLLLNALRQHVSSPQQREPRRLRGKPSAAMARRAAALVAAARPHAAAAQGQAAVAVKAAAAAEGLRAALPSLAQATGEAVQQVQSAAGTCRAANCRAGSRQVHAAAIYERFMGKLMGRTGQRSGQSLAAQDSRSKAEVARGEEAPGNTNERLLSVPEQVCVLVREATSLDNLAQMYEGWSAWI